MTQRYLFIYSNELYSNELCDVVRTPARHLPITCVHFLGGGGGKKCHSVQIDVPCQCSAAHSVDAGAVTRVSRTVRRDVSTATSPASPPPAPRLLTCVELWGVLRGRGGTHRRPRIEDTPRWGLRIEETWPPRRGRGWPAPATTSILRSAEDLSHLQHFSV